MIVKQADNYGLSGDTSEGSEARVPNVIASGCGVVFDAVGTNDRTSNFTTEQTIASAKRRAAQYEANGIVAFFIVPRPRGSVDGADKELSGDQLQYHKDVRTRMLAELPNNSVGRYVYDSWPVLLKDGSTTAQIKDGYTVDGLHFVTAGAMVEGAAFGAFVSERIKARRVINTVANPNAVSANGLMLGVSGVLGRNNLGALADSYVNTKATGTTAVQLAYDKVIKADDEGIERNYQRCVLTSTTAPTQNAAVDFLRQTGLQAKLTPGVEYEVVAMYEIEDGMQGIMSVQFGFQITSPTLSLTTFDGDRYQTGSPMPPTASKGVSRSPRFIAPQGLTVATLRGSCYLDTTAVPYGAILVTGFEFRPVQDEPIIEQAA